MTLAIITVLVYIDGWYTQNMFFDKQCGYLIPTALYLFIQNKLHCDIESTNILQIIVDSLWSLICVFQILISLFSMPIKFPLSGAILINGLCFIIHVIVACQPVSILENMIRCCLFYVCNAMLMLFFPFFDNGDKNHQLYNSSCIHKSFHLLFGHTYTLICSYSVIIGIHVNFVYQRRKANVNTSTSASLPTSMTGSTGSTGSTGPIGSTGSTGSTGLTSSANKSSMFCRNILKPDVESRMHNDTQDTTLQCLREAKKLYGIP